MEPRKHIAHPEQWRGHLGTAAMLLFAAVFMALHAVHPTADFPNHSPWMDFSKYTDEGWYGSAAVRYLLSGSWYLPGDFNPAAALPVWPLLELVVFRVSGVSLAAARELSVAVFAASLAAVFLLMRRWGAGGPAAAAAVLLLAVNPFCYAFTRLAILEPLVVLFGLLALYAVPRHALSLVGRWRVIGPLGILLPLMILTKTTALFLTPSIFFLLLASTGYRMRVFFHLALPSAACATMIWALYFLGCVRPRYLADFHYVFSANAYTGVTVATAWSVMERTLAGGSWVGPVLFPAAILSAVATLALRRHGTPPLVGALLLWLGGYAAFLWYHANLQPRYYLVAAVPLSMLLPMSLECLADSFSLRLQPWIPAGAASIIGLIVALDARQTLGYVRHPEYRFLNAAEGVRRIVRAEAGHSRLVLSGSGANLSLMTGLPSICDDFGTMNLPERVALYRPGWFLAWNAVEDDKMEALAPLYRLVRVATFAAFDDPSRNLMVLYRLDPRSDP